MILFLPRKRERKLAEMGRFSIVCAIMVYVSAGQRVAVVYLELTRMRLPPYSRYVKLVRSRTPSILVSLFWIRYRWVRFG